MPPETREPTKEEFEGLSAELTAVLKKYNAEMGVKSSIEILIRVEKKAEEEKPEEGIPSTFMDDVKDNGDNPETTEEKKTE